MLVQGSIASGCTYNFPNISQIPEYCTKLATLLAEQPLYVGPGALVKKSKVIYIKSSDDVRICDIFNANARKTLGRNAWYITEIVENPVESRGNFIHADLPSSHIFTHPALTLWLSDQVNLCSVEELKEAYNQVLETLIGGWVSARIEENPHMLFKKNPDDFYLYIKEGALSGEDVLIRILAKKFSMQDNIHCWAESNKKIYLYIKKTALEEVVDKLCFKL